MWDTQRRKEKLAYMGGGEITILASVFQQNKSILAYRSQPQSEVKLHRALPGGIMKPWACSCFFPDSRFSSMFDLAFSPMTIIVMCFFFHLFSIIPSLFSLENCAVISYSKWWYNFNNFEQGVSMKEYLFWINYTYCFWFKSLQCYSQPKQNNGKPSFRSYHTDT